MYVISLVSLLLSCFLWRNSNRILGSSEDKVYLLVETVVEQERLKEIENELASLRTEPVDLQKQADMLEDVATGKEFLLHINLFAKVIDGLQLVNAVQQIANVLYYFLLFISELQLSF